MVGVAQLVRAPDCGSGCRGFESLYPPHRRSGIGKRSQSLISFSAQGCRQVVRQGTLTPSSAGSSPAVPATPSFVADVINIPDPVAQSAEQLPFKQWVRGSNPRRVTTSSRTAYRSRRLFYKKSSLTHSVAPPFRIEPASLGFDSVWVQTWKLNEIRFSNNFFEKRISSFRKALQ